MATLTLDKAEEMQTQSIAPALMQTQEGKKTRLMITHIECENFKSYAGVQTIGPFHKCFSSIVGPNGSGKSNVIDALLFVFGKRAHQLRLKKVSELIHKSSKFPTLEFARVSVFFQVIQDDEHSEDEYEVVSGSQFTVSRFAYADGESKYFVNDKKSSFSEVGQLLRSYQIDLDNNRFLILQGEVEQIAMMKPKGAAPNEEGLLEYLEDIIGSNIFLEKIEQAGKQLEEINEVRVERVQRLKTAERERDNLSDSKIEVEMYLQKENDIRQKKNLVYQHNLMLSQDKLSALMQKLGEAQEKLSAKRSQMKEMDDHFHLLEKEYEARKKQYASLEKDLLSSSTQYDSLERKDVKVTEEMKHCKVNMKKAQGNLQRDQKKVEEIKPELETLRTQIEKYRATFQEFERSKNEAEAELTQLMESLHDETKELRAQLETEKIALSEAEKSVASLQAQKDLVENAIELIESRPKGVLKTIESLEEKLNKLLADKQSDEQQLQEIAQFEATVVQKTLVKLQQEIAEVERREQDLAESVRSLLMTIETQKAALLNQQTAKQGNKIVQALIQATKHHGPLSKAGVRGRLGDLARIPAEYDVAITTACGMLDYIVVDSIAGGQQCVEYLRKMNLGRASFVILEQIQRDWSQRLQRSQSTSFPEPRLFDLLQDIESEDLRAAFYFALRDTLVSRDLDSAVQIAYEGDRARWRVVTLGGQMIETSGAMSGGGNEVRRGGMKLATAAPAKASKGGKKGSSSASTAMDVVEEEEVSEQLIAQNEQKLVTLQQQLSTTRALLKEKEAEKKALDQEVKAKHTQREKLFLSQQRYFDSEKSLRQRLAGLEQEKNLTSSEAKEIETKRRELDELDALMTRNSPQLKTLQSRVNILQRDILAVGGMKLTKLQSKIDSYNQQMEMVGKAISSKETEENGLVKSSEKLGAAIAKSEQDLLKHETKLQQLEQEKKEMEADVKAMTEAMETSKQQLSVMESELKQKAAEYNELKEKNNQLKSMEVDLSMEIEKLQHEKKELDGQVKYWQKELETLRQVYSSEIKEIMTTITNIYVSNNLPVSEMNASFSVLGAAQSSSSSSKQNTRDRSADRMDVEEAEGEAETEGAKNPFGLEELPVLSSSDLEAISVDEVKREINLLEAERNKLKGNVNMNALIDFFKKEVNYRLKLKDLEAINEQRNTVRKEYDHYRKQRLEMFLNGFGQISLKLKEMYQMITLGGDAELELIDSLDPFSEGIAFSVRPPKKSWKQISNLSGGEKTLSSLALVFALHYYKPTPLYVMDEIDAALDFKNVSIVANYIKERTKDAQFIIISLRNNMFELADRLIGIYKTFDMTKSVTINPKKFSVPSDHSEAEENHSDAMKGKGKTTATTESKPLSDRTNLVKASK